jgi:hypothetical protein
MVFDSFWKSLLLVVEELAHLPVRSVELQAWKFLAEGA